MGKLIELLTTELVEIIGEEIDDKEFAEALEVEVLFGEAVAMGSTGYDVSAPTFNSLYRSIGTSTGRKSEKKGYIDVDLIGDLKQWRSSAEQELSMIIGDMLWKRDKVYIKDQRDFFKAIGSSPARLGQMIKDAIFREWNALGNMGLERDDPEAQGWLSAVKAGEKSRVTIRPVKGKGASGWAVEMTPAPRTILRALDLSESWAYLAKTVLGESVVGLDGELSEQRLAPKVLSEVFSRATGVEIDPKQARPLGAAFAKACKTVFEQRMQGLLDAKTTDLDAWEVTDDKKIDIDGESEVTVDARPRGAGFKRWMTPDYYDDEVSVDWNVMYYVPTEVTGYWELGIGIPLIVEAMKPALVKIVGQDGFMAARSGLARALSANKKVLAVVKAMIIETFKMVGNIDSSKGLADNIFEEHIRETLKGDAVDWNSEDFGWSMGLKRVVVKIKKGGRGSAKPSTGRSFGAGSDIMVDIETIYSVGATNPEAVFLDRDNWEPKPEIY